MQLNHMYITQFILLFFISNTALIFQSEEPLCIRSYNPVFIENGNLKKYDSRTIEGSLEVLNQIAHIRQDEVDELHRDLVMIKKLSFGASDIYIQNKEIHSFRIVDHSFSIELNRNIVLEIGMDTGILRRSFPKAFKNQKTSYAREGVNFIQIPLCHPDYEKDKLTDQSLVISWNVSTQKVVEIHI